MKVYFLNPPFVPRYSRSSRWAAKCRGGALYYPIWLAYAAGVVEAKGHEVRLVDAPACGWDIATVIEDAQKFKPEVIVSECNFQSLSNDLEVSNKIKNETDAISVIVGPPASQFPERILESGVDIVAKYEYDFTVRDIVLALEDEKPLESVKGISFKEKGKTEGKIIHTQEREFITSEELDTIPFVSKTYKKYLNLSDYFLGHTLSPMVQIFTSRGCPNQCTFCSWPSTLMGRKFRSRSPQNVVNELEYISNELPNVREIFIEDDTFTVNKKRILEICSGIKERKLDITWSCNSRANLDYESMKAMKDAGCRLLDVGYESGNDQLLKNMKKRITTAESRQFTKDAKKAGLMILADFILGMPGETKATAEQTIRFAKEIKPNIVQFSVATPIPGTEFHDFASQNGYLLVDDTEKSLDAEGFQKCIISYPDFTKEDIEYHVDKALKSYYLTPAYVPVALSNVLRKEGIHELKNMATSAKGFFKYLGREKEPTAR
jgi:anaerobic magnesium-protoporphyrin IX monomethyl ester cyclase